MSGHTNCISILIEVLKAKTSESTELNESKMSRFQKMAKEKRFAHPSSPG